METLPARRQRREEPLEVLVQERVMTDLVVELGELVGRRELAVHQQPCDLEVRRVLGELFDRIAAVAEDALLAVDVRDRGARGGRVDEAVVERGETGLAGERREVDARVALRRGMDREFRRAAREGQRRGVGPVGPGRFVHDVAHGISCDRHLAPALRPGVGRRARPEYSLDVRTAHCRIHQQMLVPIGGCHDTAVARSRSAAAAIRASGAVSDSRTCSGKCAP